MERLTLITTAAGDFVVAETPADVAAEIEAADETGTVYCELKQPRLPWQGADDDAETVLVRVATVIAIRPAPPVQRVAPAMMLGGDRPFPAA